jgi:hypothetical protein
MVIRAKNIPNVENLVNTFFPRKKAILTMRFDRFWLAAVEKWVRVYYPFLWKR